MAFRREESMMQRRSRASFADIADASAFVATVERGARAAADSRACFRADDEVAPRQFADREAIGDALHAAMPRAAPARALPPPSATPEVTLRQRFLLPRQADSLPSSE